MARLITALLVSILLFSSTVPGANAKNTDHNCYITKYANGTFLRREADNTTRSLKQKELAAIMNYEKALCTFSKVLDKEVRDDKEEKVYNCEDGQGVCKKEETTQYMFSHCDSEGFIEDGIIQLKELSAAVVGLRDGNRTMRYWKYKDWMRNKLAEGKLTARVHLTLSSLPSIVFIVIAALGFVYVRFRHTRSIAIKVGIVLSSGETVSSDEPLVDI